MALLLRGVLWLSVLGGAAVGIVLPTNNAVQSILNKQEIRKNGWNGQTAKDYENYWYGNNGFGDKRTTKVQNGQWKDTIKTALTNVRKQWGKGDIGKGLEERFDQYLKDKKLCNAPQSQISVGNEGGECFVGEIEFIDNKGQSLYGRIPIADNSGQKSNVYVKWLKCTKNPKKASAVWVGKFRKEKDSKNTFEKKDAKNESKWQWCSEETNSK